MKKHCYSSKKLKISSPTHKPATFGAMSASPLRAILSGSLGHLVGLAGTCNLVLLMANASLSGHPAATFGGCLLPLPLR